ncbi:hypothetical protein FH966_08225 [Lentibacillus cibarius]|uniref:Uncharacterized protein n=1 Tax=Lentibacillus cibarius TaxID=2583219 RepID=A0A549YIH2_9BACI|nr:hypothetical protein [Lentibacillus cibarius]TMN22879.1 hypothetical protein FFL34_12875 [Lentibacillus cibarius]TRM11670.1 hypothetical protein FH966_08225 [Lentibacillus cibarius]
MKENIIAKILFVLGSAQIVAGVIIGLLLALSPGTNWSILLTCALGGFVIGMFFIGFAENIRLLQNIHDILTPKAANKSQANPRKMSDTTAQWELEESEKEKIRDHYQDESIVEIVPSPKENYCLVRFRSGHEYYVRVVYVGGFGVQETGEGLIRQSIIKWYNESY